MNDWYSDEGECIALEPLLRNWGKPHRTKGNICFCSPRQEEGKTIHRRMPWESAPGIPKETPPHA
jgi:hypothetical protein